MPVGLLTMGGSAERFSGSYKELLPVGQSRWMCDYAIDALRRRGVRRIVIVSRPDKITVHAQHFAKPVYADLSISYVMTAGPLLWDGFRAALPFVTHDDIVHFAMPDTMIEETAFDGVDEVAPISFGTFQTQMPERFSIIQNGAIITKPQNMPEGTYEAWGVISWRRGITHVMRMFNTAGIRYDDVFNSAAMMTTMHTYPMGCYADMASWRDYLQAFTGEEVS